MTGRRLIRKNPEGRVIPQTYYTSDYLYEVEKGTVGWNVNRKGRYGYYEYSFSCETLAEVRESLATR
jgi:hypothetical protein